MAEATLLARRLANFRRTSSESTRNADAFRHRQRTAELAARLAEALDAEVVVTDVGTVVRIEAPTHPVAIDRGALAQLPGQPPADAPLICLDTETTGLGSAAGTVAFLIGLGWWERQQFRQVQLILPDQPEERALLHLLASLIPPDAWLVTYNGRSFDWPLLVARYRMVRQDPPPHLGHLDLLPTVRRLFRHRMTNARLRTAEEAILGFGRVDDVEGWEIPGRYLAFLRGGSAGPLLAVADHNDRDVRSLARLLAHLADELGDEDRRRHAPDGDLLGLATAFRLAGRLDEALACLEWAFRRGADGRAPRPGRRIAERPRASWLADRADGIAAAIAELTRARAERVIRDQVARDRARLLRHVGRLGDARIAWHDLAGRGGPMAAIAWVELAKVQEHIDRDFAGALDSVAAADEMVAESAGGGRPLPLLEADLARRRRRLERRRAGLPVRSTKRNAAQPPSPSATAQPFPHALPDG